jgi:alpha-L-fucosidase
VSSAPPEERDPPWGQFVRPVPEWFPAAKFGIFIHWGAYSVPAWAEPTGELGTVDGPTWFRHNPYAEWYANTIRLEGSPAHEHHREAHRAAPYDDFLDDWHAEGFDPDDLVGLFARAGARYVVPTAKHHDGIALWDAPGTATRNTVRRGPRRDLVEAFERATRAAGLRFGVYYSGGLDWHVSRHPPHETFESVLRDRPVDPAYAAYAYLHVRDLVDRYAPDLLWNDIEWPDAGKHGLALGLAELFRHYYESVPDGVVNDRWGNTHRDFRTSEYQAGLEHESSGAWENNRGIGLSFGYNQVEDEAVSLDGPGIVRHLVDKVSRGGNFLLDVGPDAAGRLPGLQRRALEEVAEWMAHGFRAVHGTTPMDPELAGPSQQPWLRWTRTADVAHAVVDATGSVLLPISPAVVVPGSARLPDGTRLPARAVGDVVQVDLPAAGAVRPAVVDLDLTPGRAGSRP